MVYKRYFYSNFMDVYESLEKGDWRALEEFSRSKGFNTDFMPLEHMNKNLYGFKEVYSELFELESDAEPRTHWFHKYDDIFTLVKRDNDNDPLCYVDCWQKKDSDKLHFSSGIFPSFTDDNFKFDMSPEENNIITLANVRKICPPGPKTKVLPKKLFYSGLAFTVPYLLDFLAPSLTQNKPPSYLLNMAIENSVVCFLILSYIENRMDSKYGKSGLKKFNSYYGKDAIDFIVSSGF